MMRLWLHARCTRFTSPRPARWRQPRRSSAPSGRCLLVHELSEGPRRFTQIEHSCAGISPRTLAERLRWLEAEEIVVRRSYAESPPRVEYELTEKGTALLPLITEMRRFGHDWLGCGVHGDELQPASVVSAG